MVDEALDVLSPEFDQLYARVGSPGIAPEKLLRALLLQALYSIRSERQLMEQLDYNLLFRWFVGPAMDAPVWDASTFSKNRDPVALHARRRAQLAVVHGTPACGLSRRAGSESSLNLFAHFSSRTPP